jgi:hypothetical protein
MRSPWYYPGATFVNPTVVLQMSVTTDKPQLKVYVRSQDLIDALKLAAQADARTMSVLVDLILTEWVEARGYLKPEKPGGKRSK